MATTQPTESLADLTAFQRDLLVVLAQIGPTYGLGIKRGVESRFDHEVTASHVYTVLDTLVEHGLVTKAERDGRTNNYTLTTAGERKLAGQQSLLATCLGESDA